MPLLMYTKQAGLGSHSYKSIFPPLYYPFGTLMELIVKKKKKKSLNILHFYSVY